ncbi:MAG: Gfo/Idh/MocA family oxidoreductase [Verrucomicrobia bacterium]|nr:Gfo/Idh/MocA family oxidoreductase [Verrucomicrobiota bacterium]
MGCAAWPLLVRGAEAGARAPLRSGQIGTGHAHASGKMQAMRSLPADWEVVGVVEADVARRGRWENKPPYDGLRWMTEEELLAAPGVRAVAIETEVKDLLSTGLRAVRAGKHIHLDKPAGESLPQFRELLAEAGRRGLTVQMGYMFRYNPGFQLLYQFLRDGWLGRVLSIEALMSKRSGLEARQSLLPYRGGVMFELGCHVIDAVVRVLGKPQAVRAHGRSHGTDGLLDDQLAVLEYPGAVATVRSSVVEHYGEQRRHFTVVGEEGTIEIRPLDAPVARVTLGRERPGFKKGTQEIKLPRLPRYDGEFLDLSRVIRGEKKFEFSPAHDLAVQETVLRASGMSVD